MEGKRSHKILNRQEFGLLFIQPKGGFMILTLRTVAVSTGLGPPFGVSAFGALHEQFTGLHRPTSLEYDEGSDPVQADGWQNCDEESES